MASKSKPIPGSMISVPKMPEKLVIFRVENSKYWWTRVYLNGRMYVKSTGITDERNNQRQAFEFAKSFYNDCLLNQRPNPKSKVKSLQFSVLAASLVETERTTSKESLYKNDLGKINGLLIPHFGEKRITDIEYQDLVDLLEELNKKDLAPATKKSYMSLMSKIFKYAVQEGALKTIPPFPKLKERLKTKESRDYLAWGEYVKLNKAATDLANAGELVRGIPVTEELMLLNKFMVNSFLRPTDIRVLKHKHVKKKTDVDENGNKVTWLVLSHPATKTTAQEVQTMPDCVEIYDDLVKFRKKEKAQKIAEANTIIRKEFRVKAIDKLEEFDPVDPDAYVFFPYYTNRSTMMAIWGRLFRSALEKSKIEEATGKNISLYSLRHTSIMYRLMYGKVDTLILAKNARTSQGVIEQFYGAHLTTAQARKQLHSFVDKKAPAKKKAQGS
jgi:integrase